jgi:LmbE family N-acetylglucosaminyl deacetylase
VSTALQPPGTTEPVHAPSALVVAPHADDEVLGCGGLVARLAAAGAAVRVLFLSDGGGGVEEVADRAAYRLRRRAEADKAGKILGLAGSEHLDLPDGRLADHLGAVAEALERALLTLRPALLLIPSPLEVSADHRAAFAALHRLLGPLRTDNRLLGAVADLAILVYELNHPAYPDLLVDVSDQEDTLAAAMACYASQEERHAYLAAGLGLRRYRTLSLAATPAVRLAEGYRRLTVADFSTRSPAQLIRHLGGVPELLEVREGPPVSVIVRTKDRPALLAEALVSLADQTYRRAEVVLVNDGGAPPEVPADFPLPVVRVDLTQGGAGGGGRAAAAEAGVAAATGAYIAFLDDDDLAAPEHLATLAGLAGAAGVRVAYTDAAVAVYELAAEGGWTCRERRLPYSRDFDPDLLLVDNYIPFNTLLIERDLLAAAGPFDPTLPFFEDWDLLIRLAALTPFHHLPRVTAEYRHFRGGGHHIFGERPRERGDFLAVKARVLAKHAALLTPERMARAVDTLRAEQVAAGEAAAHTRRELADVREQTARAAERAAEQAARAYTDQAVRHAAELAEHQAAREAVAVERFVWEQRAHDAQGETHAVREELARLTAEARRLYGEESALRTVVEDQTAHLGRTYAEIERLNGLIREMEATRAWRAHQWLNRRSS